MLMSTTLIIIAVVFFILAYFSKRKYGLPALALVGGSVISTYWSAYVTISLKMAGIVLVSPPLEVVVAVGIVLLPGLIMLTVGPTYSKKYQRIASSLFLAVVAGTFSFIAITNAAPELIKNDTLTQQVKSLQSIIIVVAIVAAIADSFFHHMPRKSKKSLD